jgi:hypothetical protein
VLVYGSSADFLVCVAAARRAEQRWSQFLPASSFRIDFFYSNRKRVPAADIAAALRALSNPKVYAAVARRAANAAQVPPARSEARTAGTWAADGRGLAVALDVDFSQAGVVAPPDGPDFGNSFNGSSVPLDLGN